MLRRQFLSALGFSGVFAALGASLTAPRVVPRTPRRNPFLNNTPESFNERHLKWLSINAQQAPYNAPDNVFFVTKADMDRIAQEVISTSRLTTKAGLKNASERIEQRQQGFIKFLLKKSGYGSSPIGVESIIPADVLEKMPVRRRMEFQEMAQMGNFMLDGMAEDIIEKIESQAPAALEASKGGMLEIFSPQEAITSAQDSGNGSVMVGVTEHMPFNTFASKLFIDMRKLGRDMVFLRCPIGFYNAHEYGHHVMGPRDELAEQFGAIFERVKAAKEGPEALTIIDDGLRMWRDYRAMSNIMGPEAALPQYFHTPQSLDYALSLPMEKLLTMTQQQIKEHAAIGHAAEAKLTGSFFKAQPGADASDVMSLLNKDLLNQMMQSKVAGFSVLYKVRAEIFGEYVAIQKSKGESPNNLAAYAQDSNAHMQQEFAQIENGADIITIMQNQIRDRQRPSQRPPLTPLLGGGDPRFDPGTLVEALQKTLARYPHAGPQRTMIERGLTAIENWKYPAKAYGPWLEFSRKQPYAAIPDLGIEQFTPAR